MKILKQRYSILIVVVFLFVSIISFSNDYRHSNQLSRYTWITQADGIYMKIGVPLYEKPSTNTAIIWYFTPGDIVFVNKIVYIGRMTWSEVSFQGAVKGGFEGLRAPAVSGSALSSGVKFPLNGWVEGSLRSLFSPY